MTQRRRQVSLFAVMLGLVLTATAAGLVRGQSAQSGPFGGFPEEWFWNIGGSAERFAPLLGKTPPPLTATGWVGKEQSLGDLKGKVVVIDFWGTWCKPCRDALPELAQLAKELEPAGLVVIGVHDSKRGKEKMTDVATAAGVSYPLCVDVDSKSEKAWKVSFWPTIAVIDRQGRLRAIGVQPAHTRAIVTQLLAEPAPAAEAPAKKSEGQASGN